MKFKFDKELLKTIGIGAAKVGKAIVIEGVKGVLLTSASNVIKTSFEGGMAGVKRMGIDDYVGKKKKLLPTPTTVVVVASEKDQVKTEAEAEIVEKRIEH